MPRRPNRVTGSPARLTSPREPSVIDRVMDLDDSSLLDVLDHVLSKGVMATGDLTLGVAGIDLIYVRLSALLCAADRLLPPKKPSQRRTAARKPARSRSRGRTS